MTTEQSAGAASHASVHWREVDWRSVNGDVRRLQVRIVKAVEAGRWGKVQALQRLLTSSRGGKLLAVRRVTDNQGRKTAGVDGICWDTPEMKMAAVDALNGRGYRPLLLRRIYIPKSNGKLRPLGIPTMRDRWTAWRPRIVFLRRTQNGRRPERDRVALSRDFPSNSSSCQDPERRESLSPTMGDVL